MLVQIATYLVQASSPCAIIVPRRQEEQVELDQLHNQDSHHSCALGMGSLGKVQSLLVNGP